MMPGGWSKETRPASEEAKQILSAVKRQVESFTNCCYLVFEAISYATQVVEGRNWRIKVKVGDGVTDYIHVQVFQPLPGRCLPLQVTGIEVGKTENDPLVPGMSKNIFLGGLTPTRPADEEVKKMAKEVKDQVEGITNSAYNVFEAVSYRSQIVAGMNYFIKVKVGGRNYIHVRLYRPLPYPDTPLEVTAVQEGKSESDPIEYF